METLKTKIRHVPDFPKPGILFYDITTLLRDADGFRVVIDALTNPFKDKSIDVVVGIESRGFILGGAVADRLGAGFVPVRKPGKLPSKSRARELRARVRHRLARDARRRGPGRASASSSWTMSSPREERQKPPRRWSVSSAAPSTRWRF